MSEEVEQETVSVNLELFPFDGEVQMRTIAFGLQPLVLIEPVEDDEGNIGFDLTGSGINQDELAGILDLLLEVVRNGEETG